MAPPEKCFQDEKGTAEALAKDLAKFQAGKTETNGQLIVEKNKARVFAEDIRSLNTQSETEVAKLKTVQMTQSARSGHVLSVCVNQLSSEGTLYPFRDTREAAQTEICEVLQSVTIGPHRDKDEWEDVDDRVDKDRHVKLSHAFP